MWNPPAIVRWNTQKTYLRELQEDNIPTIPTLWIERNTDVSLVELLRTANWREAVVKPVVSATAHGMMRTSLERAEADQSRFKGLIEKGGVMVQPFMKEVCTKGEWSLMFFDRKYSHAVLKRPKQGDYRVQSDFGGSAITHTPPALFISDAEKTLASVNGPILYARVDGIEMENRLCLVELEVTEPALFLANSDSAPARFAEVISHAIEKTY